MTAFETLAQELGAAITTNTITVVQIAQKRGDSVAMKYRWMNMYTGELYRNIIHAVVTILMDMIKLPQCRTTAMWQITRWKR